MTALRRAAVALVVFAAAAAAQEAASQPTSRPEPAPPSDKRAEKTVEIRKEVGVLEDVFRRRSLLRFLKLEKDARDAALKAIDPESANAIRRLFDDEQSYNELDYHYVEKIRNSEQRILNRLREDKFQGLADLLEALKRRDHPRSVAFAPLAATVDLNYRWATRKGLVDLDDAMKQAAKAFAGEVARIRGTAGLPFDDVAKAMWKDQKADDLPLQWFDRSSEIVSFEFGPIPEAKDFPRVDLATATRDELLAVPEIEPEIADAILKYRKKYGFRGAEELRFVEGVPPDALEPIQSVCAVGRGAPTPKKKWTVMVYLNAANNLEPFGIKDVNEMELAGSSADVNVVVELARYQGKQAVRPNGQYFSNPYSEFAGQFYMGLDNAPGTRRYYVLKDDDPLRVRSVMLENIGETDAGRPEPLAEFGRWAVDRFPADNYALVIWNHGAGWSGVSYDDNTHHGMDLPDVRGALEKITARLKEKQGKAKLDVLDFDACLMATLEVAYELKDTVDYLASSQETEPGDGMAYGEYLKWLTTYPEAPPASLAKAMVETYVRAYAPGGVQTMGDFWFGSETKSAMRLSRVAELKDAVEAAARILKTKPDLLGDVAEQIVGESRKFGRLVDIHDFFARVAAREKGDAALKAAVERIHELIGYPENAHYKLVNEVVVSRRTSGAVVWGFNGWATPPRGLAPFVAEARFAKTPLTGPDKKGNYTAKISFPPMLRNAKSGKLEFVKEINYRFEDEGEKRVFKDFANSFFTADFPSDAVVIAEGHNIGNCRSHGVSLYFPAYLGLDKEYRRLKFAENSDWTELCATFPLKRPERKAPIALLGLNHVTRGEREELGKIVVREEMERVHRERDWEGIWRGDFGALNRTFDAIRDPRPFGEDWEQTLGRYRDAVVVLDNHRGGELTMGPGRFGGPAITGPQGRSVMRHLQEGGRILLGTSEVARAIWDTPLYRDVLGLEYVRSWNRSFGVRVRGAEGIAADKDVTILPSRKGESITVFAPREGAVGVEPFCTLPDGQVVGAKIARRDPTTGKEGRAVVFGFFVADVQDAALRRALLKDAVAFLERGEKAEPRTLPRIEARVEAPASRPLKETPAAATGTGL